MQQLWFETQQTGIQKDLNIVNPFEPVGIDYVNKGAIEVWENQPSIQFLKNAVVQQSTQNPAAMLKYLTNYETELEKLKKEWNKGALNDFDELKSFLQTVERLMCADLVHSYLGIDPKTQPDVFKLAARLRSEDHFFAQSDLTIRKTLQKIHPELGPFITCITKKELLDEQSLPSVAVCQKRFQNFIVASNGYSAIETLDEFNQKNPEFVFKNSKAPAQTPSELSGIVASRGNASGTVKIVRLIADISKVKNGDIIVSPMTTPALMPAIRKAAAIVTDEGGALCHAAIVARELKIPCVISTVFASKIFKDGDTITVDAENGIVRKTPKKRF